jgi:hypothetical protein
VALTTAATGRASAEQRRLDEARTRTRDWRQWGPYLSERAWGTVREDYSAAGEAWDAFPHDHARSRVYRWNEDGLAGISDRHQRICFALALWNGRDPILKERLFGLSGQEGNHGEDVKEYYYYVDSTPTHSYMKFLYKYPQEPFPYERLVLENRRRSRQDPEFELADTGIFDQHRYFDVVVEYAKASPDDILIRITATNRGPEASPIHVLPTIWFRNTWSWTDGAPRPGLQADAGADPVRIDLSTAEGDRWHLYCEGQPELLFTENESNAARLWGTSNRTPFVKDGIDEFVRTGRETAINPARRGTKAAAHYIETIAAGASVAWTLRLTAGPVRQPLGRSVSTLARRRQEADAFYASVIPPELSDDARAVMRQSLAGLLWSKQYYHYVVHSWLHGDPAQSQPPADRLAGRNRGWTHLHADDVMSMPDKWEYPWFAAWDLAFHCLPLAMVDADFAKRQLVLLLREWYMHPNGQLPAYEWAFGDVNPPVHAWAALRVYRMEEKRLGRADRTFLARVFHKLLLNFTWWVNRKDQDGTNIFEGGFLGLDNIGLFDRSQPLPGGGRLEQSDGTSWMAMYTLNLLAIALELAQHDRAYEDVATKFGEHFVHIVHAMNHVGHDGYTLWDEADGFYYDVVHFPDCTHRPLKVRSIVSLVPLFAVETIEPELLEQLPDFKRRLDWFMRERRDLAGECACLHEGPTGRLLLAIVNPERLRRILTVMLDEREFLSPYGVRALSPSHAGHPYTMNLGGEPHTIGYEPGESSTDMFGGNSNWRGPVWFPMNYLIIESLQKFHYALGDGFTIECPTGSERLLTLGQVAADLSRRLSAIFLLDDDGRRAVFGGRDLFQRELAWRDLIPFHEYFHGDTGAGLGASHQTGWTALVAKLLQQSGEPG